MTAWLKSIPIELWYAVLFAVCVLSVIVIFGFLGLALLTLLRGGKVEAGKEGMKFDADPDDKPATPAETKP